MIWKVLDWTLFAVITAAIVLCFSVIVAFAISSGKPDYCYVVQRPTGLTLTAHRPWRADLVVQVVRDAKEAAQVATTIQCPFR